ncbi:MAG: hypothetical protein A2W35_07050 [Chloroflexi bacterium RBG_16_57_11]|nr:MAG: hypothetical protein A2W35_07050 [Chloroflexi bacterium RBG_16_57_11]
MNLNFLTPFENIPYFTVESFKQLLEEKVTDPRYANVILHRWAKAGHVIPLKKGLYMTRRFFEFHRSDANFSMAVSAILLPLSYVSLEYILQRRGVLTEVTYPITAITIKNTRTVENKLGLFTYRHIKSPYYYGFSISEYYGSPFAQASLAKALFDYLYLRPIKGVLQIKDVNLAEELRLNLDEFSPPEREEFRGYVEISQIPKMVRIAENLRKTIWRP